MRLYVQPGERADRIGFCRNRLLIVDECLRHGSNTNGNIIRKEWIILPALTGFISPDPMQFTANPSVYIEGRRIIFLDCSGFVLYTLAPCPQP